jgi:hypothetical protein
MKSIQLYISNDMSISVRERFFLLLSFSIPFTGLYFYLNAYPLSAPRHLPMTLIDSITPFMVWTVWPYAFLIVSTAVMPFCVKRRDNFLRMCLTLVIVMVIHVTFWSLWPISFPRIPAPTGATLSEQLYLFLIRIDAPVNCFPSAHVALPAVQLYFICKERPRIVFWIWILFALLTMTILTTKQHYLWDLIGAILVVFIALKASGRVALILKN